MSGVGPEKKLETLNKARSCIEVTMHYQMLREPSIQVSPQMHVIPNYYGGVYRVDIKEEFEEEHQLIASSELITQERFHEVISAGECKRVALIGGTGCGKTIELKKLVQKLLNENEQINSGSNAERFSLVHIINTKNVIAKDLTSLEDCLFSSDIPCPKERKHLLEQVAKNQSKVIILIDDFDQASWNTTSVCEEVSYCKEASTETLMYNLLSGNIFPNVKVIIASQEHAISNLPVEARPELVVALTGFQKEDAKELFLDLVQDNELSWKNIEHIFDGFLSMIVVPICLILTAFIYKSNRGFEKIPKFFTELLANTIAVFIHNQQMQDVNCTDHFSAEEVIHILKKLKKLAFYGMKERSMLFDENYLKSQGLTADSFPNILCKISDHNVHFHNHLNYYVFCHRSIQEFLAACYVSEMCLSEFELFVAIQWKNDVDHWNAVIQFLSGITLNSRIELDEKLFTIKDKSEKQEILRKALRLRRDGDLYHYMALHESNDDILIDQLQRLYIGSTPLSYNTAFMISSLLKKSRSLEIIWLNGCGVTDELLRYMASIMKGHCTRVGKLVLKEQKWDVTCKVLNSFLANLDVNQLTMWAFPIDYSKGFSNFQNVKSVQMLDICVTNKRDFVLFGNEFNLLSGSFSKKDDTLKLYIRDTYLQYFMSVRDICSPNRIEVSIKKRCSTNLEVLHAMLEPKCQITEQNMILEVEIKEKDSKKLLAGCRDITYAASNWCLRSLKVDLELGSNTLKMFKDGIGDTKINHLMLKATHARTQGTNSLRICDNDIVLISSIISQCMVEHLEFCGLEKISYKQFQRMLENRQLVTFECWKNKYLHQPLKIPIHEFQELKKTSRYADVEIRGIEPKQSAQNVSKSNCPNDTKEPSKVRCNIS